MRQLTGPRRAVVLAAALALLVCAAAVAAAPKPGGVYKGHEPHCSTAPSGLTCELVLRVSANGKTMRFAGTHDVVGTWRCHGGGGEAVLGPYAKPIKGQPIPVLTIAANGTFHGQQVFGPKSAHGVIAASGRFTGSGKSASITFTTDPGPKSCTNGPLALTAS